MIGESEMRYFYASQLRRMQNFGHEQIPFEDVMCQMNDLMEPKVRHHIEHEWWDVGGGATFSLCSPDLVWLQCRFPVAFTLPTSFVRKIVSEVAYSSMCCLTWENFCRSKVRGLLALAFSALQLGVQVR